MIEIARKLENGGAECIVMCTNTPHLVADAIREALHVPLLHIAEETAKSVVQDGVGKIALLGTRFTMENSFFKDRLAKFGLQTLIPRDTDREFR